MGAQATMDFFAAQAAARRRTWVLVLWFLVAWAGTIAVVYVGLALLLAGGFPAATAFEVETPAERAPVQVKF